MTEAPSNIPLCFSQFDSQTIICKICGYPGHGVHFGVISCRACAAFFRRFVVMNLQYSCVRSKVRCSLDRIRRSSCRHCRFQKCLMMGMKADKVQWNRDTNSHDTEIDQNIRKFSCTSEPSTSQSNPTLSETEIPISIQEEVYKIFRFPTDEAYCSKPLLKFTEGLKRIRAQRRSNDIKIESEFSLESLALHWKQQAKSIAYLMTHSLEFQSLEFSHKTRMFRKCWKSLYRLERILVSVEIFGEDCVMGKILALSSGQAVCINNFAIVSQGRAILPGIRSLKKYADRLLKEIAELLISLKLALEEQAFLILTFLWTLDDSRSENKFLDEISNNLHEHYRTNRVENYAPRILKMVKVVWAMKRIHEDDACGKFVRK